MLQEGTIRLKLAKVLSGYDDVRYEESVPSRENIKEVYTKLFLFMFLYSLVDKYVK